MEFSKAMIDCMQMLRRKLRTEQDLVIHLNDPQAIEQMLAACALSNDPVTRALGDQLVTLSDGKPIARIPVPAPVPAAAPEKAGASVRIYRGQRIYV